MFCKNCGSPLYDGEMVCGKCGSPIEVRTESKKIISVSSATAQFIVDWFVWSILFGLLYSVCSSAIIAACQDFEARFDIALISLGLCVALNIGITLWMCKVVTGRTFKKKIIKFSDLSALTKNIAIFLVVCIGIGFLPTVANTENEVVNIIEAEDEFSLFDLRYTSIKAVQWAKGISFEEAKEYRINEYRKEQYIPMVIGGVINLLSLFIIVPYEKKKILEQIPANMQEN